MLLDSERQQREAAAPLKKREKKEIARRRRRCRRRRPAEQVSEVKGERHFFFFFGKKQKKTHSTFAAVKERGVLESSFHATKRTSNHVLVPAAHVDAVDESEQGRGIELDERSRISTPGNDDAGRRQLFASISFLFLTYAPLPSALGRTERGESHTLGIQRT